MKYLLISFLFVYNLSFGQAEKNKEKPNIVFIYADDLGWSDLGCYGNSYHDSPNIDALASQGIRYTDAYAPAPVCSPARAGVFSGQYPARIGLTDWIPGHWRPYEEKLAVINRTQYLPLEVDTFGEVLKDNGYKTGYFGKWHLGDDESHFVDKQGFDDVVMYQGGGTYWGLSKKFYPKQDIADSVYLTDAITDYAVDFLEQNQDSTFLLVVSHFAVHLPLEVPDSLYNDFKNKAKTEEVNNPWYAGMIKSLDNSVKVITDKLEKLGLSDNTIIVFYSDNGGLHKPYREEYLKYTRNQAVTSNHPLKGEKGNLYEGGVRVPLIIKWNNKTPSNITSSSIVSGIDLFPTFLDVAGIDINNYQLDGKSLLPTFEKPNQMENRELYWHYPVYHHGVPSSSIRKGKYKLIKNYLTNRATLYDLSSDISEQVNLADSLKKVYRDLNKKLDNHLKDVGADLPKNNPNFNPAKRLEWGKHPFVE